MKDREGLRYIKLFLAILEHKEIRPHMQPGFQEQLATEIKRWIKDATDTK